MRFQKIKFAFTLLTVVFTTTATSQKSSIEPSTVLKISKSDSSLLLKTWNYFLTGLQNRDSNKIKRLSLENVYCVTIGYILTGLPKKQLMQIDLFIDSVVEKFNNRRFLAVLTDSMFYFIEEKYPDRTPANFKLKKGKKLILFSVNFNDLVSGQDGRKYQNYYIFQFIKRNEKFIFYGVELQSPRYSEFQ